MASSARRAAAALLILAVAGARDAVDGHDKELLERFAELERMVQGQQRMLESQTGLIETQQGRIQTLESRVPASVSSIGAGALDARRLQTSVSPSIFGTSANGDAYTDTQSIQGAMTHMWLILCGVLVLLMQAGFVLVKMGSCRASSAQSILLAGFLEVCLATMGWWISGWSLAYSGPMEIVDRTAYKATRLVGYEQFAGHQFLLERSDTQIEPTVLMASWFFTWACCAVAAAIVSGGMAERMLCPGYFLYTLLFSACIYPVVVGSSKGMGWLTIEVNQIGYTDFAGAGIIHMSGGVGALVGALVVGVRAGRFERPDEFAAHNVPLVALGTFLLWFGWYGLNCGSTMSMSSIENGFLAAQVAMNTTISAATGGLVALLVSRVVLRKYVITRFCNGILAGLVAISAACGNVESSFACLIGAVGSLLYFGASLALIKMGIDDPVDAFAVHGVAGAWGVLAAAIFDWGAGFDKFHGRFGFRCVMDVDGCKTGLAADGIVANAAEIGAVFIFVGLVSLAILLPLRMMGLLKAKEEHQEMGVDERMHMPQKAYTIEPVIGKTPLFRATLQAI